MQDMAKNTSGDLTIRLNPTERRKLEAAAAKDHLPVSTWLRRLALKASEGVTPEDEAERQRRIDRALAVLGTFTKEEADALRESVRQVREGWGRGRR
jgi:methylphosphotriester-DNA--protein-cysteine methyltransferase